MAAQAPDAVVFPKSTDEVAEIVRLCASHRVPMVPYGTGTSFEGHVNAPYGGISIDTSGMDRDPGRPCRGPRLRGRARRHPQGAEPAPAGPRPVLPHRPRRRRVAGRHGGHAGVGHQCGALRHHEGQRAVARGRDTFGRGDADVAAGAEIGGGLRPHPSHGRAARARSASSPNSRSSSPASRKPSRPASVPSRASRRPAMPRS